MTTRIRFNRFEGKKLPPGTILITRPGRWGNPFKVIKSIEGASNEDAVRRFKEMLDDGHSPKAKWILDNLHLIRAAKHVACTCKEDEPCHGDVLIELAEESKTNVRSTP